jgi:hypothetical protein
MNMDDPDGRRRLSIELAPSSAPRARVLDSEGQVVKDAFAD